MISAPPLPAFILGAGLGTRLRPLTESLPKPMISLWNKPLLTYAFDHLIADLGTNSFIVNTHHAPEAYPATFPDGQYRDCPLELRHEPTLLNTAGGIDNIRDWISRKTPDSGSIAVYNGDILTDLPLAPAVAAHLESDNLVTMVLRSEGHALQVALDQKSGQVTDISNQLKTDATEKFQFTGIYFVRSEFVERFIEPGKIESVISPILNCLRDENRVGGVIVDEGQWNDLGNRETYLDASTEMMPQPDFPRYEVEKATRIHPDAQIDQEAEIDAATSIGAGVVVKAGAKITRSIIWENATVEAGVALDRCVVRDDKIAAESASDRDF
ncbi:MAG: hypothetical protein HKN23_01590 [Verrucomicrobiales bacterium]|nr:hypothetical protein [Verrucomicrobiales bacterium]